MADAATQIVQAITTNVDQANAQLLDRVIRAAGQENGGGSITWGSGSSAMTARLSDAGGVALIESVKDKIQNVSANLAGEGAFTKNLREAAARTYRG